VSIAPQLGPAYASDMDTTTRTTSGVCNGTLGELFQGPVVHNGQPGIGLVSFPVDRYAWAHFTEGDGAVDPLPVLPKAAKSVRLFLHRYGLRLPQGAWSRHTELDMGVGMASSTADIVATLRCLFQVFGRPVDMAGVTAILARIERADSVFLDEFSLYLSDRHEIVHTLGTTVGFHTCFVVEPGAVDTAEVTPRLLEHYRRRSGAYRDCLDGLLGAFRAGDTAGVARAATASATLSQDVLPKASYDAVLANRRYFGADGIFVAHTGRVIGYLFAARLARSRMDELSAFFRDLGFQCSFAWGGHGGS
jgi:L-threonine kinase